MEHIPVEVWEEILILSCVDGGRTGCSLSLVSRAFHDASRHSRYHSVALKGLSAALKFLHILDKHPSNGRRVHHLYATDQYPYSTCPEDLPNKVHVVASSIRMISQIVFGEQAASPKNILQAALEIYPFHSIEGLMHMTLRAILITLAPTLQTLLISIGCDARKPQIPSLPCLTELTLAYAFGTRVYSIAQVLDTLEPLPSLRMLDLLGLQCHATPEEIMVQVAKVAPDLTHICLPIIRSRNIQDMKPGGNRAFWNRVDGSDLTIHMQSDPWGWRSELFLGRDQWFTLLDALNEQVGRRTGRVVLHLRDNGMDISECYEEHEGNWLARIIGDRGRWHQAVGENGDLCDLHRP